MLRKLQLETSGPGLRVALVASRFHDYLVEKLIAGAHETLLANGVASSDIELVTVPGSFELPLACKQLAQVARFDALVALGVLVRGGTSSYDLICSTMIRGLNQVSLEFSLPIGLGVITAENLEQAAERAGGRLANRGSEAAIAALHMARLAHTLRK